ncbi:DUF3817 domain-containing protein [Streptomyces sp. NPDC051567]|uniref:DUF3817 domain-containing protein n=1 Tax=Streptomyces sp. NPDC051567 TaxID=3365660 RepID=UPI0037922CF8
MPPRHLRIAAHAEIVTLCLLLANLATVHDRTLSALLGPVHGCAYLLVVLATLRLTVADPPAKLLALVPGIGGLAAVRRITRRHPTASVTPSPSPPPTGGPGPGPARGWNTTIR